MTSSNAITRSARDYERIESAIRYIEDHKYTQPTLPQIAAHLGVSESYFQRLFSRWAGISPKRFLQFLTLEHTKRLLRDAANTLDTAHAAGLSSTSRLHELYIECEAITPGEYKEYGNGLDIRFGFHQSPFGECLVAMTPRGLCALLFVSGTGRSGAVEALEKNWRNARLTEDPTASADTVQHVFAPRSDTQRPLYMFVKGTNFQIKVWEALLRVPRGQLVSYQDLSRHLGAPGAARAVANAVAHNPIHFLIPCHRVIRNIGEFGGYQGGTARKKAIHAWEAAQRLRTVNI
jgi:AraC family transcriptional regulator of adaptative response/methylated-DNA-[protein]-cysteine methyltransferase